MEHVMKSKTKGAIVAVTAAAIALTGVGLQPAVAAQSGIHQPQVGSATDFSSRARYYRRGNGNAAALGTFLAIAGTGVAIAASRQRQRDYYGYGYQPSYGYGYQPYGYAAPGYYGYAGPRYYGGPRGHHGW
jgi:hypothetical protein